MAWIIWHGSFRYATFLLAKRLCGVVDGLETLLDNISSQVLAEFKKKEQKVLSAIALAVSTPQLYFITSCEKPKDGCDALWNHFEQKDLGEKLYLKGSTFEVCWKKELPLKLILEYMKEITDKLVSTGTPISEEDQVVTLLGGSLPQGYCMLVTALEVYAWDWLMYSKL